MLSLDKFSQEVASRVTELLDVDAQADLKKIMKNNGHELTGLVVQTADSNIAPTIYLESYYEEYLAGFDMDEIMKKIAYVAGNSMVGVPFDVEIITSLDRCRDRIVPRLVNTSMNRHMLESRPHRNVEDLSVTYCVLLDNDGDAAASVPVTYQLMDAWGLNADDLYDLALENQRIAEKSVFLSMKDVLKGFVSEESDTVDVMDGMDNDAPQIYILSNESKLNGAAAILDSTVMSRVIDQIGKRFYILPSSVHEVLIVPDMDGIRKDALESMVKEVNSSVVSIEDQLSDHVYVYSPDEGLKLAV